MPKLTPAMVKALALFTHDYWFADLNVSPNTLNALVRRGLIERQWRGTPAPLPFRAWFYRRKNKEAKG